MPTGIGFKSYVQIGKEVTPGTPVAATKRFEVISFNLDPVIGTIQDPSLYSGSSRRSMFQGGLYWRGRMLLRMNYEGLERILEGVMGSVVDAGAGPYTHTFKEAGDLPSYTLEMIEGDIPAAGQAQQARGVKFTGMTIRGTAGQGTDAMVQLEVEMIAKLKVPPGQGSPVWSGTPAVLTAPAIYPVLFHQATTVDNGYTNTGVRVRNFEISIQNPLADDRFYLGSTTPDDAVRNNFLTARWKFQEEFQDVNMLNASRNFTGSTPQLIFTDATRIFEMRSNSAKWVEFGTPIEGYGIILVNHTQEAFYDATDATALYMRLTNSLATS